MTQTLIAVDVVILENLTDEIRRLHQRLDAALITPRPEWVTVKEYANHIGRSERTVTRRIDSGELDVRHQCGVRMVRVGTA
ncbi:hypothetical protein DS901_13380 [Loktanella sp. D2R18]|uniref:hypothetical protein n=1 Tax=Rhodobacterales TaxID=204455 RepID=UPI000DEA8A64|nr:MULTISPECIES: hypothetical protein [Rhodobacterales]MDO6591730.1 hypothetical protein [Yoonia sp. 1_MG-2023]RBW42550.1 hypothetical protein DS901_13380 [Loktanella sp. D2R18]